jgi:hypothetical protein
MQPMKKRIYQNVWGNWNGYEGTRKTQDFGLDEVAAVAWFLGVDELEVYRRMNVMRVTRAWSLLKTPGGEPSSIGQGYFG